MPPSPRRRREAVLGGVPVLLHRWHPDRGADAGAVLRHRQAAHQVSPPLPPSVAQHSTFDLGHSCDSAASFTSAADRQTDRYTLNIRLIEVGLKQVFLVFQQPGHRQTLGCVPPLELLTPPPTFYVRVVPSYVPLSFSTRVLWSVFGRVRQRPGGSGETERGHLKGHGQNQRGEWRRLRPPASAFV